MAARGAKVRRLPTPRRAQVWTRDPSHGRHRPGAGRRHRRARAGAVRPGADDARGTRAARDRPGRLARAGLRRVLLAGDHHHRRAVHRGPGPAAARRPRSVAGPGARVRREPSPFARAPAGTRDARVHGDREHPPRRDARADGPHVGRASGPARLPVPHAPVLRGAARRRGHGHRDIDDPGGLRAHADRGTAAHEPVRDGAGRPARGHPRRRGADRPGTAAAAGPLLLGVQGRVPRTRLHLPPAGRPRCRPGRAGRGRERPAQPRRGVPRGCAPWRARPHPGPTEHRAAGRRRADVRGARGPRARGHRAGGARPRRRDPGDAAGGGRPRPRRGRRRRQLAADRPDAQGGVLPRPLRGGDRRDPPAGRAHRREARRGPAAGR